MSYDENQLPLPPSFHAVYLDDRKRLTASLEEVQARYELCEDLAQHLVGQTVGLHHDGLDEQRDILQRFQQALEAPDAGLTSGEPTWIVRRLAELLNWSPEALPLAAA